MTRVHWWVSDGEEPSAFACGTLIDDEQERTGLREDISCQGCARAARRHDDLLRANRIPSHTDPEGLERAWQEIFAEGKR